MDGVIFAHKPMLFDVAAQLKRSAHAALGLAINLCAVLPVAGQRTHGTIFLALKVTFRVATPGAESAIYDWLVGTVKRIEVGWQPTLLRTCCSTQYIETSIYLKQ